MKKGFIAFLILLLLSPVAFAHRLNEYLIATTIYLSHDKISIEFRLTPGVAIAPSILKDIDRNGDNKITSAEQQLYINRLTQDLSFTLDGHITALKLVSSSFPTGEAVKKGIVDIIIDYEADLIQSRSSHQIKLKNTHYSTVAIYLVNCLLPADTDIHVTDQTRSADQSFYRLNFSTADTSSIVSSNQGQLLEKSNHTAITKTYFVHGVWHILTGYDHLLFLCALILGAVSLWDLIKIVTAFTIAHSITLTLASLGYAHVPGQIVEPIIAASIVFVAVQNIALPNRTNSNIRLAVAFFFGLFHGLGFAGGLLELMHTMSTNLIWYAILGFSLGVEAGNQLMILPLYTLLQLINRKATKTSERPGLMLKFKQYSSGLVAIAGLYYFIIDLAGLF